MLGLLKSAKTPGGPLGNERGFTLTELLVALVIASLVFVGAYRMYINSLRVNSVQNQVVNMQQNARVVMDQLTRELRLAGYDPNLPEGGAAILNLGDQTLELNSGTTKQFELQGDFDGSNAPEVLVYKVENDTNGKPWLTREIVGETAEAVQFGANIEELELRFYDENNNKLDTAGCGGTNSCGGLVRRVTVRLTARTERPDLEFIDPAFAGDPDPMKKHFRRRVLEADVILRNTGKGSDTVPPHCPTNVVGATNGDCRTIRVTWTAPADDAGDLAGYYIYYEEAPNSVDVFSSAYSQVSHEDGVASYEFLLSVPNEGNWNIAVASFDTSGNLCDTTPGTDTPDPVIATGSPVNVGASNKVPEAPGNVIGKPGGELVSLTWADAGLNVDNTPANDLQGFRVYRSLVNEAPGQDELIADESALPISQSVGGGTTQITSYVDNDVNTPSGGPENCQLYYYWVSVVDQCGVESEKTEMNSIKPDGELSIGVTPPNNGTGPPVPQISQLVVGDDTSFIIVHWNILAPTGNESMPIGVKIRWRVDGQETYPDENMKNVLLTGTLPASGETMVDNLQPNTLYWFKVTSYDDGLSSCVVDTDSLEKSANTNECAPRFSIPGKPVEVNHKIVPGNNVGGVSVTHDGTAEIGALSPSGERFVTWVSRPHDCLGSNVEFGPDGFDFLYDADTQSFSGVAIDPDNGATAHVLHTIAELDKNPSVEHPAHTFYGKTATGENPGNTTWGTNDLNYDAAPAGEQNFYHYPADPSEALHMDTSRFCDGRYEFTVTAWDSEVSSAFSSIQLDIKNGGIELVPDGQVATEIQHVGDWHNLVTFPLQNTNPGVSFRINKIAFSWWNNNAYLDRVVIYGTNKGKIGEWRSSTGTPSGRVSIGTEITLNPAPVVGYAGSGNNELVWVALTFRNPFGNIGPAIELRPLYLSDPSKGTVSIVKMEAQNADVSDPNEGICPVAEVGEYVIPIEPFVDGFYLRMDKPFKGTFPTKVPKKLILKDSSNLSSGVTISTKIYPASNRPIGSANVFYLVDQENMFVDPERNPFPVNGGPPYPQRATGAYDSVNDVWNITIPSYPDSQIWWFLETMDGLWYDSFDRNYDIVPDRGGFTYVQCGTTPPTLSLTKPNGAVAQGDQVVNVDVSSPVAVTRVEFLVKDSIGDSVAPATAGQYINMCQGSGGLCGAPAEGSTTSWTAIYDSDDPGGQTAVPHDLEFTVTNVCGNTATLIKEFNK